MTFNLIPSAAPSQDAGQFKTLRQKWQRSASQQLARSATAGVTTNIVESYSSLNFWLISVPENADNRFSYLEMEDHYKPDIKLSVGQDGGIASILMKASAQSGGLVLVDPARDCLPYLVGVDGKSILLRDFVEYLDGVVDYDELREEMPTLSFAQISSAIEFLRKLAQMNTAGVDLDALQDKAIESNPEFIAAISRAVKDQEISRVLDAD